MTDAELKTIIAQQDAEYAAAYEQAYEAACEIVSPNSIEFAALHERLIDELLGA